MRITPPILASGTKKKLLWYPNIEPPWLTTRMSLTSWIQSPMPVPGVLAHPHLRDAACEQVPAR